MATYGQRNAPHSDKPRTTADGHWLTQCRMMAGLRQSDLSPVLAAIKPSLGNQGRPCELETGKMRMTTDIKVGLYAEFRRRLGDDCPPPP